MREDMQEKVNYNTGVIIVEHDQQGDPVVTLRFLDNRPEHNHTRTISSGPLHSFLELLTTKPSRNFGNSIDGIFQFDGDDLILTVFDDRHNPKHEFRLSSEQATKLTEAVATNAGWQAYLAGDKEVFDRYDAMMRRVSRSVGAW